MTEAASGLLERLKVLSGIDGQLAIINADSRKQEKTLKELREILQQKTAAHEDALLALHNTRQVYEREQRFIKNEQNKLVERRKALAASGSEYKTQMAGEREIEHASRQLSEQEDKLVEVLVGIDEFSKTEQESRAARERAQSKVKQQEEEVKVLLEVYAEQLAKCQAERSELLEKIDPRSLQTYTRVATKYPADAVVGMKSNTCQGCFLNLGPQTVVQISRGEALIRCRGCGRILFIERSEEE